MRTSTRKLPHILQLHSQPDSFINEELQVRAPGAMVVYCHPQAVATTNCDLRRHCRARLLQTQHYLSVKRLPPERVDGLVMQASEKLAKFRK